MSKPGRNDACPCGSGRKYKRGCLEKERADDQLRHRQIRLHDALPEKLQQFAFEASAGDVVTEAWETFWLWDEQTPSLETPSHHFSATSTCANVTSRCWSSIIR